MARSKTEITLEELDERVYNLEYLLDRARIRTDNNARFEGSTWEVSDRQIAQWVAGTTLPLGASSSYARFKNGSLEIRGGKFDIHTAESGARMTMSAAGMYAYNAGGDATLSIDFTTGDVMISGTLYISGKYRLDSTGIHIETSAIGAGLIDFRDDVDTMATSEQRGLIYQYSDASANGLYFHAQGSTLRNDAYAVMEAKNLAETKRWDFVLDTRAASLYATLAYNEVTLWGVGSDGVFFGPAGLGMLTNDIWAGYPTNADDALLRLNYYGHLKSADHFRDLTIYNGKAGALLAVDGSAASVQVIGRLGVSAAALTGGYAFTATTAASGTSLTVENATGIVGFDQGARFFEGSEPTAVADTVHLYANTSNHLMIQRDDGKIEPAGVPRFAQSTNSTSTNMTQSSPNDYVTYFTLNFTTRYAGSRILFLWDSQYWGATVRTSALAVRLKDDDGNILNNTKVGGIAVANTVMPMTIAGISSSTYTAGAHSLYFQAHIYNADTVTTRYNTFSVLEIPVPQ